MPLSLPPALPLEAPPAGLAQLYETHGHLVLQDLPSASLLTLDGISLTVSGSDSDSSSHGASSSVGAKKEFRGFKLVPPGWHSLVVTPASEAGAKGGSPMLGAMEGMALRSLFLFHIEAKEVINMRWDGQAGHLVSMGSSLGGSEPAGSHVLTPGLITALDRDLTPYPLRASQYAEWSSFARPLDEDAALTRRVAQSMLGEALTTDALDPVSGGALEDQQRTKRRRGQSDEERKLEEDLLRAAKRTGQGPEGLNGTLGSGSLQEEQQSGESAKKIRLADFSLLRSWPEGALAAERTRWSRDKSWALRKGLKAWTGRDLQHVENEGSESASDSQSNDQARQAFLLSFHLLFHLFISQGSEDLLLAWRNHISLVCQSASAIGSYGDVFGAHPSEAESPAEDKDRALLQPGLHAGFLQLLRLQLNTLGREWFAEGGQEVESAIKSDLKTLRGHMSRAMALDAREKDGSVGEVEQGDNVRKSAAADSEDEEAPVVIRSSKSSVRGRQSGSGIGARSLANKGPRQATRFRPTTTPPPTTRQDFESLLSSWRSLSLFATAYLGWQLDEQTDEEAEVLEELDEEHDEAVRRAMVEMAEEEGRQADERQASEVGDDDAPDDLDEFTIQY